MAIRRWNQPTAWDEIEIVLDVDGLMALLRISETTALGLLQSGQIPAVKVGKSWRISREAVRHWLERAAS